MSSVGIRLISLGSDHPLVVLFAGRPHPTAKEVRAKREDENRQRDARAEMLGHHEAPDKPLLLNDLVRDCHDRDRNPPAEHAATPDEHRAAHRAVALPLGDGRRAYVLLRVDVLSDLAYGHALIDHEHPAPTGQRGANASGACAISGASVGCAGVALTATAAWRWSGAACSTSPRRSFRSSRPDRISRPGSPWCSRIRRAARRRATSPVRTPAMSTASPSPPRARCRVLRP